MDNINLEFSDFIAIKKRVVIKIGTQILLNKKDKASLASFKKITGFAYSLIKQGKEVILVSSGAIAIGRNILGIDTPSGFLTIPQKQALAACGQTILMNYYASAFKKYALKTAQILLTKEDTASRKRFNNARNTIDELLRNKIIPVINENDTISTDEIKFSDNDYLSALAANLSCADLLIILSNIGGVHDKNPAIYKNTKKVNVIRDIETYVDGFKENTKSRYGTGGMKSKLEAAKIAAKTGIDIIITNGKNTGTLKSIAEGKLNGTLILSSKSSINKKKHWLLFGMEKKGTIVCDEGAEKAIVYGNRSLLASGIIDIIGNFKKKEGVYISNKKKQVISIGISDFNSEDIKKIKGLSSSEIKSTYNNDTIKSALVVHKNNMVTIAL